MKSCSPYQIPEINQHHFTIRNHNIHSSQQSIYDYPQKKMFILYQQPTNPSTSFTYSPNLKDYHFQPFDISQFHYQNQKTHKSQQYQKEVQYSKPEPFMGAFLQTQHQFKCFDINVKVPSIRELQPFSRILSHLQDDASNSNPFPSTQQSRFQIESVDLSQIENASNQQKQPQKNVSLFQNLNEWLQNDDQVMQQVQWDNNVQVIESHIYEIYNRDDIEFVNRIQEKVALPSSYMPESQIIHINNEQLCREIAKMIQGIEGQIFILDYEKYQWQYNMKAIRLKHIICGSFVKHIAEIIQLSNYKSRIQIALDFIKKQPYRRVYQEIARQAREVLLITEEIALEEIQLNSEAAYIQYYITLTQIKSQVCLIYQLLINQYPFKSDERSFTDFNYNFLNSEAVIFSQILRLSISNDSLTNRMNQLVLRLLRSVFKPITFCLNQIIFQETTQITNRDETYLKYYFQNIKDILSFLGKRISLIKQQSNQLYLICKIKQSITLVTNTKDLRRYEKKWKNIFDEKMQMIEQIKKKDLERKKIEKQKKYQQKIKQIYELKVKLLKRIEEEKKVKSKIMMDGLKETERLKKQIAAREKQRRLNELIEKQQEKGFLLEAQLNEKRKLIKQKQILIRKAEELGIQITQKNQKQKQKSNRKKDKEEIEEQMIEKTQQKQEEKQQKEEKSEEPESENVIESVQENFSQNVVHQLNKKTSLEAKTYQIFEKQMESDSREQTTHVSTNTVLEICIDNILRQQIQVTQVSMGYLVYDCYQLSSIIEFMRKIFLTGNGQAISELLRISVNFQSKINLKFFSECILFDYSDEAQILKLQPSFYEMKAEQNFMNFGSKKVSIFHQNLQSFIGFQFRKLPLLLQPYFSYIHLSKYMQILTFIIRIRHGSDLVSKCWKLLNEKKKQIFMREDQNQIRIMNKLYATRYIIQIFLSTLENYLYYRVIEKEVKLLRQKLQEKQLNQLSSLHLKMLDTIIRVGLIDNPHNDISKIIRGLLAKIRDFKNIIDMFYQDDMPHYLQEDAELQIDAMRAEFKNKQYFLENLFYHP